MSISLLAVRSGPAAVPAVFDDDDDDDADDDDEIEDDDFASLVRGSCFTSSV